MLPENVQYAEFDFVEVFLVFDEVVYLGITHFRLESLTSRTSYTYNQNKRLTVYLYNVHSFSVLFSTLPTKIVYSLLNLICMKTVNPDLSFSVLYLCFMMFFQVF